MTMKFRSPHGYLVHHLFKIFRLYPAEIPNQQVPDPFIATDEKFDGVR